MVQQWGRVPALNTHPTFIDDLAAMVLEKLPSAAPRPGYTPSLNETMNLGPPTGEATFLVGNNVRRKEHLHVGCVGRTMSAMHKAAEEGALGEVWNHFEMRLNALSERAVALSSGEPQ